MERDSSDVESTSKECNDPLLPSSSLPRHRSRPQRRWVVLVTSHSLQIILLFSILFLTLHTLFSSTSSSEHGLSEPSTPLLASSSSKSIDCGTTHQSASAAGCIFDPLGYHWVPPACYDAATVAEFQQFLALPSLEYGAFPFFRSADSSDRIASYEELSQRVGMKTYSTQQEHLAHCVFLMRRLERARGGDFRYDGVGGYAHIEHCSSQVLDKILDSGENKTGLHAVIMMNVVNEC
ncbi:hypothetical protein K491DRAFT_722489 [Lophiostoma macrostomum CBS 122681]|uniref:Uncharacterized protein n=1 Tax=Lophiostoma macrostomum CBS 122681 TaxID=1314788 RepID=A0A6A6SLM7_9PLEO|nr:hypothetical protein K491DRAFT_722489 [Lophiostoma macrostomum CBS 122681]